MSSCFIHTISDSQHVADDNAQQPSIDVADDIEVDELPAVDAAAGPHAVLEESSVVALPDVSDDEGDDSVDSAHEEAVSCNICIR